MTEPIVNQPVPHPSGDEPVESTICRTMDVGSGPLPVAPPPSAEHPTIPGYQLLERLGAGGYGEVWRALAPGGLEKAVKIVYGHVDDARASTELKSLERVKHARHPFLLVLERFEVVESRLVVVTELAEGSLKDVFDECRAAGKAGVARGDLLKYVRDAADALDFMYAKHGLVHLDVKPENVLLVGGHAKVADFGLTQCLDDERLSNLGGLTPQFAAPEVFEGQPSRHSDQYSLAILYQMLLTGEPPFNGRTAAQLTAQHLNSAPVLSPLPPSDRPAIARALAKNPAQRFGTCLEMVEALLERPSSRVSKSARSTRRPAASQAPVETDDVDGQIALRFGTPPPSPSRDHLLPPAEAVSESVATCPALVIGLGGLGGRVVAEFDGLRKVAGSPDGVRLLHLDTDPDSVNHVGGRCNEASVDTLATPLRSAAHYRRNSARWLEWIDRRWLYNVPRSLRTEGIRALGRLAYVDHEPLVRERLVHALQSLPENEDGSPAVVVLAASTSGGTGSGMLLDVARTLWSVAAELDRAVDVRAVLAHVDRSAGANSAVPVANTVSLLSELQHVSRQRELQTADAIGEAPIGFSEILLSDESGPAAGVRDAAARRLAQILRQMLATPTGPLHDADRAVVRRRGAESRLGLFGIASLGDHDESDVTRFAGRLEADLRRRWSTRPTDVPRHSSLQEALVRSGFESEHLASLLESTFEGEAATAWTSEILASGPRRSNEFLVHADVPTPAAVTEETRSDLERRARGVFEVVAKGVASAVSEPGHRFGGGLALLAEAKSLVVAVRAELEGTAERRVTRLGEAQGELLAKSKVREDAAMRFLRRRIELHAAESLVQVLAALEGQIVGLVARVEGMRDAFLRTAPSATGAADESCEGRLLDELDRRVQIELQSRNLLFGPACGSQPDEVAASLELVARRLAAEVALHGALQRIGANQVVATALAEAAPAPRVHGASRRLLSLPNDAICGALSDAATEDGPAPAVVVDEGGTAVAVQLVYAVPFAHVVKALVGNRANVLALADQLHTRLDVDWRA